MPYITQTERVELEPLVTPLCGRVDNPGKLNYLITRLCHAYLRNKGGLRYEHANAVVGALDCAKMELYRTIAAPYENEKGISNGEITEFDEPFFSKLHEALQKEKTQ